MKYKSKISYLGFNLLPIWLHFLYISAQKIIVSDFTFVSLRIGSTSFDPDLFTPYNALWL